MGPIQIDQGVQNLSRINRLVYSPLVVFGEAHYGPRGTCGPRVQDDYQIVAVLHGSATVTVPGSVFNVPANHVALMLPGALEHFRFDPYQATYHTWCAVKPSAVKREVADRPGPPPVMPLSPRMHALISSGLDVRGSERESWSANLGISS
jgi:hypothetical protein